MMSHNSKPKYLIVIGGPTASGKTRLAIELARHFNTEIVSADSRQFYAELEIGTAKPSKEELDAAPHHFINSLSIKDMYSVGDYEKEAVALLAKLYQTYDVVVMVGGSGLFIRAVCEGLDELPEVDPQIRDHYEHSYTKYGLEFLQDELAEKDPEYFQLVDRRNHRRLIRALEVIESTGEKYSSLRTGVKTPRVFRSIKIAVEIPREELYRRIDSRMDTMIEDGLFEEAHSLKRFESLNPLQTVGYSEIFAHFNGDYSKEEAIRLLKRNSRRYAKRQMTWFKKDREFEWFSPDQLNFITHHIKSQMT